MENKRLFWNIKQSTKFIFFTMFILLFKDMSADFETVRSKLSIDLFYQQYRCKVLTTHFKETLVIMTT